MSKENRDSEEPLLEAYRIAHDLHKFYVAFRFTIVGFLATVNGALYFFRARENAGDVITPVAGIVACLCVWLLDKRNRVLFDICIQAARDIESEMELGTLGVYKQLFLRPKRGITHGIVIKYASLLGVIFWSIVLIW